MKIRLAASLVLWCTLMLGGCNTVAPQAGAGADFKTASDMTATDRRVALRLELAVAYLQSGQPAVALDEVKQALTADPRSAAAYSLRGAIYQQLNDLPMADESFRRAVAIDPRSGDALHNYGAFLCETKHEQDGIGYLKRALEQPLYGNAARSWMVMGICQSRTGDNVGAEASLKRAVALDSANQVILFHLAEILFKRGDLQNAQYYFGRLRAVGGNDAAVLWLGIKIANASGDRYRLAQLATELKQKFPASDEAAALARGNFNL